MIAFDSNAIIVRAVPVLCIDTCSLLDIMRDPTRDGTRPHERSAAVALLDHLERGRLVCLVADQVALEFNDHDLAVQDEAMKAIEKLRDKVDRANQVHGVFLPPVNIDLSHLEALVRPTRQIIERWLNASTSTTHSAAALARAMDRVNRNVSPARKGKDSVKDCLVLETYLEAIDSLRALGLRTKAVFLSSNSKEYLSEAGIVKADLQPDFHRTNMDCVANMAHAKVTLGF